MAAYAVVAARGFIHVVPSTRLSSYEVTVAKNRAFDKLNNTDERVTYNTRSSCSLRVHSTQPKMYSSTLFDFFVACHCSGNPDGVPWHDHGTVIAPPWHRHGLPWQHHGGVMAPP